MNIKDAKKELLHTIQVYTRKDAHGRYLMPAVRQRPLLLIGPPGIGKNRLQKNAESVLFPIRSHTTHARVQSDFP